MKEYQHVINIFLKSVTVKNSSPLNTFTKYLIVENKSEPNIYRDDLMARVERLEKDKNDQTEELMKVKVEAAGLKIKVEFLERELDRIKSR